MTNEIKKRTKPCISCKLSKVKCEYATTLPCKRCARMDIACQYADGTKTIPPAIPTRMLPSMISNMLPSVVPSMAPNMVPNMLPNVLPHVLPNMLPNITPNITPNLTPNLPPHLAPSNAPSVRNENTSEKNSNEWISLVDNRLKSFESVIESMLSVFQNNQLEQQSRMDLIQNELNSQATLTANLMSAHGNKIHKTGPNLSEQEPSEHSVESGETAASLPIESTNQLQVQSSATKNKTTEEVKDFRESKIITKEEAKILLDHFMKYFGPHLYGFKLDEMTVDDMWSSSPLLLVSICTISCSHHSSLSDKFSPLKSSLEWFASQVLIRPDPNINVEHTIIGLVIASLWLSSTKMFSSLALHLARIWRIDQLHSPRLEKLWCLLYILDGTENLTSHKSPSIYKDMEPLIRDSRKHAIVNLDKKTNEAQFFRDALLENTNTKKLPASHKQLELLNEVKKKKMVLNDATLQDLRLLTQLEYHMAMESVFHNKNTQLPSLYNESLEATMALLPSEKFGVPWGNNMDLDKWMISWTIALQNIKVQNDPWCFKSTLLYYNFARMHINTRALLQGKKSSLLEGSQDLELVKLWHSQPSKSSTIDNSTELLATKEISRSAAIALLKLATKDRDMKPLFQFFPVHIYIMLYYASLVVLDPNTIEEKSEKESKESYKLAHDFKDMLRSSTITDAVLKKNLTTSLIQLLNNFKEEFYKVEKNVNKIYELFENNDEKESSNNEGKPRPILAWPGTNHGHP